MKDLPLISVIVPVYGVERYLDQCIRSIVNQTYQNLEIILVEDGSPDCCGAICDAWAEKDSRITVIHQKNAGAGAARNTALDIASGEYIGMIDSDDYISCNMYQHLIEMMTEDVDIAECGIGLTQSDDFAFDDCEGNQVILASVEEAMCLHIKDELFRQTPPNKLYRASVINTIRFPVGNLIDDEFFTYRVIGNCRKLVSSSACLYAYRQQANSAMHKQFSLRRLQGMEAKTIRLAYLKEKMPMLVYEAKFDLLFYCMYLMQQSLLYLPKEDCKTAKNRILSVVSDIGPVAPHPHVSAKKNLLLRLAQWNFVGTCTLLAFLMKHHVLD